MLDHSRPENDCFVTMSQFNHVLFLLPIADNIFAVLKLSCKLSTTSLAELNVC